MCGFDCHAYFKHFNRVSFERILSVRYELATRPLQSGRAEVRANWSSFKQAKTLPHAVLAW
eukprot:6641257-Prymnesium_polylepis.1